MPKQKDLKRLIRGRMRKTGESYTAARARLLEKKPKRALPSTNGVSASPRRVSASPDGERAALRTRSSTPAPRAASPAKGERDHASLAGMSDEAVKAKTGRAWSEWVGVLDGHDAARLPHREIAELVHRLGVPDWWAQTVAVGYERIRGLREIGQRRDGSYEATKSKTITAPAAAVFRAFTHAPTRRRWLPVPVTIRTAVPDKSVRMTWKDGTSVEVYLVPKGVAKSQVAIQHRKLPERVAIARMKEYWSERLDALAELVGED